MEVVWLRRARRHLAEIVTYIADDNPTAAISVRQRIEEAARSLSAHPDVGRQGRMDGTRELVIHGRPYIIPYRVRRGRVEILAVIHSN
jgi:addiction module RelE/StbE family toxin